MITRADWQVRNSQRRYPLDEGSTGTSDTGVVLPEGILVDASIWVPKYLYGGTTPLKFVCVSSIMTSEHLVSLTLLGCTADLGGAPSEFVPIGSISLSKPIDTYRNYPIEPLLDGVMGWVAFGQHAMSGDPVSLAFSTPAQAMLTPKAARFYEYLPITSMSSYDSTVEILGDVRMIAQAPVTAEIKDMRISGELSDRKMLVIGLEQTENVLAEFAGLCGKRPETGNCLKGPITSIAGVPPSCDGNINITFANEIIVRNFTNPAYPVPDPIQVRGGICLDSVFNLDQACSKVRTLPDENGLLPNERSYVPPCDLEVPLTLTLSDDEAFTKLTITQGYVYMDGDSAVVAGGMDPSAELVTCLTSLVTGEAATVRTHRVDFTSTPEGCLVGMFLFDTTSTRVLFTVERGFAPDGSEAGLWNLVLYDKQLEESQFIAASDVWGDGEITSISVTARSDASITVMVNETEILTYTFDPDGPQLSYYDPNGLAGVYVGGADQTTFDNRPGVSISEYSVTDEEP